MMTVRRGNERGHASHGWLEARHTFSFGDFFDPQWMGFRTLRVINDDRVAPGGGFPTHPHRDMEIITYVLEGALEHKDSMGNGRVIRAGEFQYMSAGSGVRHSEFNPSETESVHLLQMWVQPDEKAAPPRYEERDMRGAKPGQWHLIASKSGRDGSIAVRQDMALWLARFVGGEKFTQPLAARRHAWVHVAEGAVLVNGTRLEGGDAVAVTGPTALELQAESAGQVLLFDLA